MRYRDCPTVEVSRLVAGVAPAQAWALVVDITLPTRHPGGELREVEWCEGSSSVAVGARFRGTSENPHLGRWSTVCEVVECDAGSRWVWRVLGPGDETSATWGFEVEPASRGTIVRQWARMGPGRSGLSAAIEAAPHLEARIVAGRLEEYRAGMTANLDWLHERLTTRGDAAAAR
jgi:hypothetical protein